MTTEHSLNEAQEVHISSDAILDPGFSKGQESLRKGSLPLAEEIHIPDYVMLDFGFSKRRSTGRKLPT